MVLKANFYSSKQNVSLYKQKKQMGIKEFEYIKRLPRKDGLERVLSASSKKSQTCHRPSLSFTCACVFCHDDPSKSLSSLT